MLKIYNGRFESIIEPDRLFVKDSLEGGKAVVVAKYFGVGPSGELKGVSEEAVRIGFPWLGSVKGFLLDSEEEILNLLSNYISKIHSEGLTKEQFVKSFNEELGEKKVSHEQLEHIHDLVSRTDSQTLKGGVKDLRELLFKLEEEIDNLMIKIKNAFTLEAILDRATIEKIVEEAVKSFSTEIENKYGVRNIHEILKVKILPFP
jgi:hypothetical protein